MRYIWKKHGMHGTPTYNVWGAMLARCRNPKHPKYSTYGARGIKVCKRWENFSNFFEDMGLRPENMSLDRIDNDGNYSKENCRWATAKEQMGNTSKTIPVTINGVKSTFEEVANVLGVKYKALYSRLFNLNWSSEKILKKWIKLKKLEIVQ